ncbi:hypothetical protein M405DRAFT_835775 [Rhizopogon salebrosus TDB-379]|nr:hypothetical protein M405DRAFT_835775 [Rhizopogon salebrosus TDB-379]
MPSTPSTHQQPPSLYPTSTLCPGGLLQLSPSSLRSHPLLSSPVRVTHSQELSVNVTEGTPEHLPRLWRMVFFLSYLDPTGSQTASSFGSTTFPSK